MEICPITDIFGPISIGIALGLFLGKQLGIMSFTWLAVKAGIAELPRGLTWAHLYGASLLAGIGFTMSLFIGTLAWSGAEQAASLRVGVLSWLDSPLACLATPCSGTY